MAVTKPELLTVALLGSLLDHVNVTPDIAVFAASFAVAVSCWVAPSAAKVGVPGATVTEPPRTPRINFPFGPAAHTSPLDVPPMAVSATPEPVFTVSHTLPL